MWRIDLLIRAGHQPVEDSDIVIVDDGRNSPAASFMIPVRVCRRRGYWVTPATLTVRGHGGRDAAWCDALIEAPEGTNLDVEAVDASDGVEGRLYPGAQAGPRAARVEVRLKESQAEHLRAEKVSVRLRGTSERIEIPVVVLTK